MKKLFLYVFLVLMFCNIVKADVENYEDLLKGKYSCSDRTSDVDWDFSFSKISNKNYYVEADGIKNFGKPFAQWRARNPYEFRIV